MVAAVTANDATTRTDSARTSLATNFQTFLSLLTTQLKNQDPLSPLDSNEFTQQLTQMTGVEQQLLTNDLLTSLLNGQNANGLGTAATYIGKQATAAWSATRLDDGKATWSYELATEAADSTVSILDANGATVWKGKAGDLSTGVHDFTWDGKTTDGRQLPDGGVYTMKITATTAAGQSVDSQVLTRGQVTGVEMYDGAPYLTIGSSIVPLSTVIALDQTAQAATTATTSDEDDPSLLSSIASTAAKAASALNPLKLIS